MQLSVLYVVRSLDPTTGGPAHATERLCKILRDQGVSVDVVTTVSARKDALISPISNSLEKSGARVFEFRRQIGSTWSFSSQLWRWLKQNGRNYDLVHITGVFTFPAYIAAHVARQQGVPYVIRPAGTLDTYARAQKAIKKMIFLAMFGRKVISSAKAIHATSSSERRQLEKLGFTVPIVIVPLSVSLPDRAVRTKRNCNQIKILFLSRIHPVKCLPALIKAFSLVREQEKRFQLIIAGDGESAYVQSIRQLVSDLLLSDAVSFTGFVSGKAKSSLLAQADLFILPSYQENFGLAVVEAMAAWLPVIVSDQVALAHEIKNAGAGHVFPVDDSAALAREILLFCDEQYRDHVGKNGRLLVEMRFSDEHQRFKLGKLYEHIVGDGEPDKTDA